MIDIGNKVKSLCRAKKIPMHELANKIGLSRQGLYSLLKNNSTTIETLEKIAKKLEVPISHFFTDNLGQSQSAFVMDMIPMDDVLRLEKLVQRNAINGKGLVFLDYDPVRSMFTAEFRPLKQPLTKDEYAKMMTDNLFSDLSNDFEIDEKGIVEDND